MHISIAILTLSWLQTLPTGSPAPASANTTAKSFTLELPSHPQLPSDLRLNAAETVDYPIPHTTTVIHFVLGPPLPPAVMCNTILSAYNHISATIASEGDSTLPASEDPFVYNRGYGAFIGARSAQGRHLTWSLLEGAVVGLYNGLYLMGIYRASAFRIWDGGAGLVGVGEMGADVVVVGGGGGGGRNGTVGWRGVVDVGKGDGRGNGNLAVSGGLEIF